MIDRDELLYVVDENNRPQEPKRRYQVHGLGLWHRTSHIWVVNSQTQILCQKRSMLKDRERGKWIPFFGGHQGAHETEIANAIGELREELGIEVNPSNFELFDVIKSERQTHVHNEFLYTYLYPWDGELKAISPEPDEVEQVAWRSIKDVRAFTVTTRHPDWVGHDYYGALLDKIEHSSR